MGYVIRSTEKGSLNGIRTLVYTNLLPGDLPDSVIDSPVFLRAAELEAYKLLGITSDTDYATKTGLTSYLVEPRVRFPKEIQYQGEWTLDTAYDQNDIVHETSTSPNRLYVAKTSFMSGTTFDPNNWNLIQVNFKGLWHGSITYHKGDIVFRVDRTDPANPTYHIYFKIATGMSDSSFNSGLWTEITTITQTPEQRLSEERIRLSVQYLAAIKLIPALPQILEEQILRERVRYQEIDWEKRLELYHQEVADALEDETDVVIYSTGAAIYGEVKQYVAF